MTLARRLSSLSLPVLAVTFALGSGCNKGAPPPRASGELSRDAADASAEAATAVSGPKRPVDREQACAGDHALREREASALEAQKFKESEQAQSDDGGGWADYRLTSTDRCGVAKNNVDATIEHVLALPQPTTSRAPLPAWDRVREPTYLDRVNQRFRLTVEERAALARNGFFASERMVQDSYGSAFHDVFQSELPVFVSMDALFQAIYAAHDGLLADIEQTRLAPMLTELLARLSCALVDAEPDYPGETAHDLDTYLTVARMLLNQTDKTVLGDADDDEAASALAGLAREGTAMRGADGSEPVVLFGRPRVIDFTQYTPRGHYADASGMLDAYFRAVMWLSRLELNVKTRDGQSSQPGAVPDRSETPREARLALALADLAERSGSLPLVASMDRGFSLLAGKREDISIADLLALRKKAGIARVDQPDAPARLTAAIGEEFKRTARMHFMPEGVKELPAIVTLLGPRAVPDAAALRPLVHDELPNRFMVGALDVAFMLGHDRAKAHLGAELAAFPALGPALLRSRDLAAKETGTTDLYSAWFTAARATAADQGPGAFPAFTRTDAYRDMKLDTGVAAFGQLRHNYVLLAGQAYDSYGCEIPDGYVEPAPKVLDALIAYAGRGETAMRALDPVRMSEGEAYFARLSKILRTLRAIVSRELAGEPMHAEEKRFLSLVAEYVPHDPNCTDSCAPPHYSGWWFDLHPKRKDGLIDPSFVIDYYTSVNQQAAAYVGAEHPVMGVFVVEQGGPPRAFVGPVARAFGQPGPISPRLTDADAAKLPAHAAPWRASYVVPSPAEPPLLVTAGRPSSRSRAPEETWELELSSTRSLGTVTVTLLDHHRRPVRTRALAVGVTPAKLTLKVPRDRDVSGLFVTVEGKDFSWVPPKEKEIWDGLSFALGSMREVLDKKRREEAGD